MKELELPGWFKVLIFFPCYLVFTLIVSALFYKLSFIFLFESTSGSSNFIMVAEEAMKRPDYRYLLATRVALETIGLFIFLLLFKKIIDSQLKTIFNQVKTVNVKYFLKGISIGILAICSPVFFLWLTGNILLDSITFPSDEMIYFLIIYFGIALIEEIVVRGYVLMQLVSSTNILSGTIISSLLFSLLHAFNDSFSWIAFSNLFFTGIFLSLLFLRFHNLWLIIGVHFAWNFFQGVILGFNVSGVHNSSVFNWRIAGNVEWTGGDFGLEGSLITSIILVALIVYLVTRFYSLKVNLKSISLSRNIQKD